MGQAADARPKFDNRNRDLTPLAKVMLIVYGLVGAAFVRRISGASSLLLTSDPHTVERLKATLLVANVPLSSASTQHLKLLGVVIAPPSQPFASLFAGDLIAAPRT